MKVGAVMVERTMGVEVLDQEVVVVHVERQKRSEGRGGTMSTEEVGGEGEIGGRKRKERCSTDGDDVGLEE
jgi:hypothetical protein